MIFEDEGHGIDRWQNNIRHARRVEEFLAKHLGGRSGGFDYIEIAVEVLDCFISVDAAWLVKSRSKMF
ncbi:MAG: hypothetical protein ABJN14_09305 [Paracoccaceae bacterium]